MKIQIIAAGHLRKGALYDLCAEYQKRITSPLIITEIESRARDEKAMRREEHQKLMAEIADNAYVVALDERGQSLSSLVFADKLERCRLNNTPLLQLIIGGANGLSDDIRRRANLLLSFGKQTWPHMMARVMLMEQLYRAQQIHAGHPYHKA